MENDIHPFSSIILSWYSQNKRNLPWRKDKNPYSIWLSEIILQQTRIEQGMEYYFNFIENFPTVKDLSDASQDKVLSLWQGLGYYSRARNLHAAAKMVVNDFNGEFPNTYEELRKLPGVGPYTASAIASIVFNLPHAVVDGNVYRLLSRYFNIDTPIDSGAGIREFFDLANELISKEQPGDFNQAMMDFGSMVCRPKNPNCSVCPLNAGCNALMLSKIEKLPVKKGKIKVRKRYFVYLLFKDDEGYTLVRKRGTDDIWGGLYEFPILEFPTEGDWKNFESDTRFTNLVLNAKAKIIFKSKPVKHVLSHQQLHAIFVHLDHNSETPLNGFESIAMKDLKKLGMPRLITRYLEENGFNE